MAMLHYDSGVVSEAVRASVLGAIPPEAWGQPSPLDAWSALGQARYGVEWLGYLTSPTTTTQWLHSLAEGLSKPHFTVTLTDWMPHRAEIMEWLTEEYARLGIGEPPSHLQFRNNWSRRIRRRVHRSGALAVQLHANWDGSNITRNVAALCRKDFN